MADYRLRRLAWALCLLVGGGLLLLLNFNLLAAYEPLAQYIMAGGLALVGIGFFAAFARSRSSWWRLIPAWTFAALAAMLVLSVVTLGSERVIASLLFLGLTLAFAHIYLLNRSAHWWAIIPGGFLGVLGVIIALSSVVSNMDVLGAALFVGIGGVFFLLYLLDNQGRQWWALIPGGVLVLFGVFVLPTGRSADVGWLRWWPVAPMATGALLLWRAVRTGSSTPAAKFSVNHAPARRDSAPAAPIAPAGNRATLGEAGPPAPGASIEVFPEVKS